ESRVFDIGWQRVAVAAALIGLVVFAWTLYPSGNNIPPATLARQEQPVNSNPPNIAGAGKNVTTGTGVAEQEAVNPIAVTNAAKPVAAPGRRTSQESKAEPLTTGGLLANNMETSAPALPFEKENTVTERASGVQISGPTAALPASQNSLTAADMVKAKNTIDENTTAAALTQPAVYKELDTDDEKKSLYLGSIEINKDKLRGFFRKAGSIFRSKARQQEEERSESTPANTRSLK
ncbi:MAG: hypothetical protein JWQ78_1615, partial [Sediminibacterium sp.]|nr:hypothetical protein [Sediminibacterium sp.]